MKDAVVCFKDNALLCINGVTDDAMSEMSTIVGACDVVGFSNNGGDTLFILVKELEC